MNDATRELGAALGIAVLGSIAASRYASAIDAARRAASPGRRRRPPAPRSPARSTSRRTLPGGRRPTRSTVGAEHAFVGGIHLAVTVGAVLAVVAAVIVYRYLPHQLAPGGRDARPVESMEDAAELGLGGTCRRSSPTAEPPTRRPVPVRPVTGHHLPSRGRPTAPGPGRPCRRRPAPLVHARHRDHRGADRRARHHGPERRDPHDPARVRHDAAEPAVGDHRLLAHVRQPPDHRRPARRPLRRAAACSSSAPRSSASARSLASLAQSVPVLVVGEAIIEGIGASLMMPATLGILSTTFHGRERATAFAVWGATAGAAVAFGPLLGGFLTTNYSWRWAFRINVDRRPARDPRRAAVHAAQPRRRSQRERIDVPGALLVASGMFLLVFALSEGGTYGWWRAARGRSRSSGPRSGRPTSRASRSSRSRSSSRSCCSPRSTWSSGARSDGDADPLFEFGQLRRLGFRYGLLTTLVLAMGQLGFLFVLPVFLQDGRHLSAVDNGLWLLPSGICDRHRRPDRRAAHPSHRQRPRSCASGLVLEAVGLLVMVARHLAPTSRSWSLLPGLAVFGIGIGFASSQLTNVMLSEIPKERAGVGERREHDRAPARRRARHRGHRRAAHDPDRSATPRRRSGRRRCRRG